MTAKTFKTTNGDTHLIDRGGNHFINGRCVNPLVDSEMNVGDTYPDVWDRSHFRLT